MAAIKAAADFTGALKANVEYAQGSFDANGSDNRIDTVIVPNGGPHVKILGKFNSLAESYHGTYTGGGGRYFIGISGLGNWGGGINTGFFTGTVSADTNPHVFEMYEGYGYVDGNEVFGLGDTVLGAVNTFGLLSLTGDAIERWADFTMYKAEITHNNQVHTWNFDQDTEAVVYTIDGVVQAPPTIQGIVTSDQWGEGAARQITTKYSVVEADKTLSVQWYDHTDPDNVVAKVMPIADFLNIDNNQQYIDKDTWKQLLYSGALDAECQAKVAKYMDFSEPFMVSDGVGGYEQFTVDGEPMYVYKEEVER